MKNLIRGILRLKNDNGEKKYKDFKPANHKTHKKNLTAAAARKKRKKKSR